MTKNEYYISNGYLIKEQKQCSHDSSIIKGGTCTCGCNGNNVCFKCGLCFECGRYALEVLCIAKIDGKNINEINEKIKEYEDSESENISSEKHLILSLISICQSWNKDKDINRIINSINERIKIYESNFNKFYI